MGGRGGEIMTRSEHGEQFMCKRLQEAMHNAKTLKNLLSCRRGIRDEFETMLGFFIPNTSQRREALGSVRCFVVDMRLSVKCVYN